MSRTISDLTTSLALRAIEKMPTKMLVALRQKFAPQVIERIIVGEPYGGNAGRYDEAFRQAYAANMWVFRCVSVISQNIAQVPLGVYESVTAKGKQKTQAVPGHFIQALLDRPNAYLSAYELLFLTTAYLELTGDAFWFLPRLDSGKNASQAGAIILMRPTRVTVIPGEKEDDPFVLGYEYRVGAFVKYLLPEDVIHFKYPNPNDDYRGQSTLEAGRDTYLEDKYSRQFNQAFYKNAAVPKGGLVFESELQAADYKRIRREWNAQHLGVENAHKIAIFEQGSKWVNIGITQKDMDFILQRKLNRDDMGAIFGVPPVLLNSYERATYNNADRQVAFFWHETEIPKLALLKGLLTLASWKFFGRRSTEADRTSFDFDLSQVWALKRENLEDARTQIELVKSGLRTQNELREKDNLQPAPYGDVWWRSNSLIPTDSAEVIVPAAAAGKSSARSAANVEGPSGGRDDTQPHKVSAAGSSLFIIDREKDYALAEWRAFIVGSDHFEGIFRGFIENVFKDQLRAMQKNLREIDRKMLELMLDRSAMRIDEKTGLVYFETKKKPKIGDIETIVFDKRKATKYVEDASDPLYRRTTKAGGQRAFVLSETSGTFDLADPNAVAHMTFKKQKLAKEVSETTWNSVTESLAAGINDGDSIAMLADRLNDVMLDRIASKYTIARTEVIGSMNGGLHDGYEQTGVVKARTWSTAGDEVVRDPHEAVGGKTLPLNEKFKLKNRDGSTSELLYPGDPNGSAEQVINCRCTELPAKRRAP